MSRIVGVGIDVVELSRVAAMWDRYGDRFAARFCLPAERQERAGSALIQHLGGLFAAKEAVLKALGTGWSEGLGLLQVQIVRQTGGAPSARLHRAAAERARRLGVGAIHLSITHERGYAAAVAILEGEDER